MSKFAGKAGLSIKRLEEQIDFDRSASSRLLSKTPRHSPHHSPHPSLDRHQKNFLSDSKGRVPLRRTSVNETSLLPTSFHYSSFDSPTNNDSKLLGTLEGVFLPTTLNIFGIIVFVRLGYCVGNAGILLTIGMFLFGYIVTTSTSLSISAIATNGTIKGGGPYYMLSRTLGPEFGGSIGLVFYIGILLACSLNVVSFTEPLLNNFGVSSGTFINLLPESQFWVEIYQSMMLIFSALVCLFGSKIFAKANNILSVIIGLSALSILVSFFTKSSFNLPDRDVYYTGLSWETFQSNLYPDFGFDAYNNQITLGSVFGVLFPACVGIMAGVSMSGSLKNPNTSIPKGTLYAVALTITVYLSMVLCLGSSVRRSTLKQNMNVLQEISSVPFLVPLGAISTTVTSLLTGDVNFVASYVTLFNLMMFMSTNLALLVLKSIGAINFRPSFHHYNSFTTVTGVITSFIAMIVVDTFSTIVTIFISLALMIYINHCPQVIVEWHNSWGDVTQGLIYHQVRKYLLQLRQDEMHIKYWRPQILLLISKSRNNQLALICNEMKKGGLYILGQVVVGDSFTQDLALAKKLETRLINYIETIHYKAFAKIAVASSFALGARQLTMSSGLGGMRPNIVVMDFDDTSITPCDLVQTIEESLQLKKSIALASNFNSAHFDFHEHGTIAIDLWPLQVNSSGELVYMSNFDSYTMVLQLGAIMKQQLDKKTRCVLRMFSFVENEFELQSERALITELLVRLRIVVDLKMIVLSGYEFFKKMVKDQFGKNNSSMYSQNNSNSNLIFENKTPIYNRLGNEKHRSSIHQGKDSVLVNYYNSINDNDLVIFDGPKHKSFDRDHSPLHKHLSQSTFNDVPKSPGNSKATDKRAQRMYKAKTITFDEPEEQIEEDQDLSGFFARFSQDTQLDVLNQLMCQFSVNCDLIITTCPIPNLGSSKSPETSEAYANSLKSMIKGLKCPIMLVHTTTLSVTTLL
ncbi:hypothetical protein BB560_005502 [Smittium megazygosporum]|uniref:Amino acid permease/ SLC12A domain-containing protein n=1 Tax=Smittium megazygosporum TaxID=133381 RepID=A0A2T9Z479_9FUNG|nr:hypothetical protein BB560_005502 [Smittium megazygosporum]